ncbi:MAG: putative phosphoribosyltransferase [Labilithrix sp.]|nr:putative phosphoribosyltransferase [Labilithrix sp.]
MSSLAEQQSIERFRFVDRRDAGRRLAGLLAEYAGRKDVVVLALPRGGVPVGYEVAKRLGVPLDVFLVRKLGFPDHSELAMGAIASGGVCVLNEDLVRQAGITQREVASVAAREAQEIARREREYRGLRPALDPRGLTVILVDDGLATGATMRAAAAAIRAKQPARIVVAVPVAAVESCEEMKAVADEVVCAFTPAPFHAVGLWYDDFTQVTDEDVADLLARARAMHAGAS